MNGLRKFGLWLSALIVGPAVITAIVSFTFTRTIGSPDYVKQTFAEVKIYEALGNFLQAQAKRSTEGEDTTIQKALAHTATEPRMQNITEQAVDQAYAVLDGEIAAKDFSVDISEFKEAFLQNLDNSLSAKLAALPPCTFANPPTSTDVLEYSCLPPGADIDKIVAEAKKETVRGNDLLQNSELSITTLSNPQAQQTADEAAVQQSPQDTVASLQEVADLYQLGKLLLPIAAGFALLSGAGVVILSQSRLRGGRRLGALLAGNALVFVVISFIIRMLGQNFPVNKGEGELLPGPAFELAAQRVVIDFATMTLWFGVAVFAIGIGLVLVMSSIIAKKAPHEAKPSAEKAHQPPTKPHQP